MLKRPPPSLLQLRSQGSMRALTHLTPNNTPAPLPLPCPRTALLQYANIEAGCTAVKGSEIAWNETEGRLQTDEEADAVDKDCEGKVGGKRNRKRIYSWI